MPGIHFSWPIAFARRLYFRSSDIKDFRFALEGFVERLRGDSVCEVIVQEVLAKSRFFAIRGQSPACAKPKGIKHWLVLPFHPVLYRNGVGSRAVSEFRVLHGTLLEYAFSDSQYVPEIASTWCLTTLPFGCTHIKW